MGKKENKSITPSKLGEYIKKGKSPHHLNCIKQPKDGTASIAGLNAPMTAHLLGKKRNDKWNYDEYVKFGGLISSLGQNFEEKSSKLIKENLYWEYKEFDLDKYDETELKADKSKSELKEIIKSDSDSSYFIHSMYLPKFETQDGDIDIKRSEADFVFIEKLESKYKIYVLDAKNTIDKSPDQYIQTACYIIQLEKMIDDMDLDENIEVVSGGIFNRNDYKDLEKIINNNKVNGIKDIIDNNEIDCLNVFKPKEQLKQDVILCLTTDNNLKKSIDGNLEDVNVSGNIFEDTRYESPLRAAELYNNSLSLVGMSRSEQKSLKEIGIENIGELSKIIPKPPNCKEGKVEIRDDIEDNKKEKIEDLHENRKLNKRIEFYAEKAQSILRIYEECEKLKDVSSISDNCEDYVRPYDDYPNLKPISIDHYLDIPHRYDKIQENSRIEDYNHWNISKNDNIVSIYIDVQYDYWRDKVFALSGSVYKNGNKKGEFGSICDEFERERNENEKKMLEESIGGLSKILSDLNSTEKSYINVFMYSKEDLVDLTESIERCRPDLDIKIRHLLGLRDTGEKQQDGDKMVTTFESYISNYCTRPWLSNGIIPVYNYLSRSENMRNKEIENNIEIENVIYYGLFDQHGTRLVEDKFDDDTYKRINGEYLSTKGGSNIPAENWWGTEEIDKIQEIVNKSDFDKDIQKEVYKDYKYIRKDYDDENYTSKRVSVEHLLNVSKKFADCLHDIHGNLLYKQRDFGVYDRKKKYNISKEFIGGDIKYSLESSANTYEKLEYKKSRDTEEDLLNRRFDELVARLEGFKLNLVDSDGSTGTFKIRRPRNMSKDKFEECISSMDLSGPKYSQNNNKMNSGDYLRIKPPEKYEPKNFEVINFNQDSYLIKAEVVRYINWDNCEDTGWKAIKSQSAEPVLNAKTEFIGDMLKSSDNPPVNNMIEDFMNMDTNDHPKSKIVNNFISDTTDLQDDIDYDLNQSQKKVVNSDARVVIVQGPPGTGKTHTLSGLISKRVECLIKSDSSNKNILVTGSTNKAIDELLDKTQSILDKCEFKKEINRIRVSKSTDKENNYYEEDDVSDIIENKDDAVNIIFATPYRTIKVLEDHKSEDKFNDGIFDITVIDESSMMSMSTAVTPISTLASSGQLVICGDHRQLEPVQKYEWEDETKKSIRKLVPYISVLDYFRFFSDNPPRRSDISDPLIPTDGKELFTVETLNKVYRHNIEPAANLLTNGVYEPLDNEELEVYEENESSSENSTLNLILYEDDTKRKMNNVEKKIIIHIIKNKLKDTEDIGIVTPHKAQRANLLNSNKISDSAEEVEIDTVEKFQGGERETMFVSTTVSDPEFIQSESDFILDLNRLNVAISRMKKHLFIIAPLSIFKTIPTNINDYKQRRLLSTIIGNTNVINEESVNLERGSNEKEEISVDNNDYKIYFYDLESTS